METQSYENVEAAIYSNQEEVSYYIPAEDGDDYVFPDAEGCETEEGAGGERQNYCLYPPQNLTDTDGESYENMESSLYAQPRRQTQRCMDADEEDYIDPDGGNGERGEGENHCNNLCPRQNLTDTDGESYENMESSLYAQPRCHSDPNRPHSPHASQEEEEEDSYEKMASITQPDT
ncbi:B-lymphocyte antigen CD19-like [Megalops cyprinoides]|uniref:B-lymphocyte antigen CD19-like n=1 Tax=Megalops cyprinoides TaxID=118141 RepID=UPI00186497CB|nr:B-lymphocyte antigen CD19-like [Megalops cyprinoides]